MNDTIEFDIKGITSAINQMQSLTFGLGGSAAQSGVLRSLGRGMGFDPNSVGASLQSASLNGLGVEAAMRYGLPLRPLEIGSGTNRADMLIKAIDGLRKTFEKEGMGGAIRDARNLNIEALLPTVLLQKSQLDALKRDAAGGSGQFSIASMARAVQLQHELTRLNIAWQDLINVIGARFIPLLQQVTSLFVKLTNFLNLLLNSYTARAIKTIQEAGEKSTDENTRATNDNTAALKALMPGMYGGGRRARNSIPAAFAGLGGFSLNEALNSGALNFGAYSVGMG